VVRVPAIQRFNGSDFSVPLPITRALHRAVERFRPDLVHSHHPFLLGDTALRIAAAFDLPIVFTHHTRYEHFTHYVPLDSPRMERFAVELATSYANLCDLVFAPSQSLAAMLGERGVRSRVEVVPTGVDLARFAAADGGAFRRARDIPAEAIAVGHVGRLAAEKNLAFLADALAKFAAVDPRVHVLIAGDGPEAPQIRARFGERGLGERLHLVGVLQGDPLAAAYRAMDVFAFASRTETQGLVLAEAMAAGVPVVAIEAAGASEVVRDRINGRLLSSENVEDFAAALAWVAGARETLRAGALATAGEFSIDRTGERALGLYRELVQSPRVRAPRDQRAWSEVRRRLQQEWRLAAHRAQSVARSWESPRSLP
jgi:glycosyltransferase involved in cell wall biosynthesis